MGIGKDGIQRFPRTGKDKFLGMIVAEGHVPRGYDHVTKRQKKLIKLIVGGMAVRDACHRADVHPNTYYRWRHYHKPFMEWYARYAKGQIHKFSERLDAKFGRAVQIIEDSMDNPDPYFKHDVAVKYLSGRGHYKRSEVSNQIHTGAILHGHTGKVRAEVGMDKELVGAFVKALAGVATGTTNPHDPRIIPAKVLKSLPEPRQDGIDTKISKSVEAEIVRDTETS